MILKRAMGWRLLSVALLSILLFFSCSKDNSASNTTPAGKQSVAISLNDGPISGLTSVMVDLRYVEVKVDTGRTHHEDSYYNDDHEGDADHGGGGSGDDEGHHGDRFGKWDTLTVNAGVYDLLQLMNGKDTLIANSFAHQGKITMIRITLGSNNSITDSNSHVFPLSICNGSPYIYVKVPSTSIDTLSGGQSMIHLDFDISRSIRFDDGQYCLKPVLKSWCHRTSGSIEGSVTPAAAHAAIMAFNDTDTAFALPWHEGEFKIRGLTPGTYSVLYHAFPPYQDTTLTNIVVQQGSETKLPVVNLHP
jgi:hypothetical protein